MGYLTDARDVLAEMKARGRPAAPDARPAARARAFACTAGQAMTLRRAGAFAATLDALSPFLYESDCLAGSAAAAFGAAVPATPEELAEAARIGERTFGTHHSHVIVDFPRLLRLGFPGLRAEVDQHPGAGDGDFLRSVAVALDAAIRYVARYGAACRERAAAGPDSARWEATAARCDRLAAGPPASFPDAVQLTWFAHHLLALENRYANGFGRLDQYLLPFYLADVAQGKLTPEDALGWLTHLWAKVGERSFVFGSDEVANIAIGGLTPEGADGTNVLSYLCLRATRLLRIPGPNLSARFHPGTPDRFYLECIETFRTGVGYPALFSDAVIVPAVEDLGVPAEEARDYAPVGCIETFLPGLQPPWADSRLNLAKCLELVLGNGRDLRTGDSAGPATGEPAGFTSFDAVLAALDAQIRHCMRRHAERFRALNRAVDPAQFTSPFLSALMTDCVARGKDINDGGTRYPSNHGVAGMGLGTVSDSLAAIRRGVFEENRFDLAALVDALRAGFAGHEALQAWVWNRAPKYGNDDPAADDLAVWVAERFNTTCLAERTYDGGRFLPLIAANVSNIHAGKETAATPDGRRAGAPLSDAGSPTYGRDRLGPTAVVRSVTKVDWRKVTGGSVINQKYHPEALATAEGRERLMGLLKAFFALGGQEVQFNVVTPDLLRQALERPQEHADLVVRVSGFSARFTALSREVQMDILERTTHARV